MAFYNVRTLKQLVFSWTKGLCGSLGWAPLQLSLCKSSPPPTTGPNIPDSSRWKRWLEPFLQSLAENLELRNLWLEPCPNPRSGILAHPTRTGEIISAVLCDYLLFPKFQDLSQDFSFENVYNFIAFGRYKVYQTFSWRPWTMFFLPLYLEVFCIDVFNVFFNIEICCAKHQIENTLIFLEKRDCLVCFFNSWMSLLFVFHWNWKPNLFRKLIFKKASKCKMVKGGKG